MIYSVVLSSQPADGNGVNYIENGTSRVLG